MKKFLAVCVALAMAATPTFAGLVDHRIDSDAAGATVDQALGANEYGLGNSYSFAGAGNGFGGTVGNGVLYMNSDNTNLYIGMQFGNAVNDLVAILIDSKAGGFVDATMGDNGDGCRRALTNQAVNTDDPYSAGFLADYGVCLGNFGNVLFEMTADPNPINFMNFDGAGNQPFREYAIPLASLGIPAGGSLDFLVAYVSDSGYASNESIPAYQPLQANGNPGFGDGQFGGTMGSPGYGNHDRFSTYPEPTTLSLLGLGALTLIRRKR